MSWAIKMKVASGGMVILVFSLAAWAAGAENARNSDNSPRLPLTPFSWRQPAPESDAGRTKPGAGSGGPQQAPATEADDLECEQGVVHPEKGPQDMRAAFIQKGMGLGMGVQRCRRKSAPGTIIERPVTLMDPVVDAVRGALEQAGTGRRLGSNLTPFNKPRKAAADRNTTPKAKTRSAPAGKEKSPPLSK